MSSGVNKVILVGNLGADPEIKYTDSGRAVANFNIATSESWNDKDGQRHEKTEWHRIVCWARLAELAGEYLSKGRQVYVEGKLQTRQWDDRDGNKRYTTEVMARELTFLGGRSEGQGGGSGGNRNPQQQRPSGPPPDDMGYGLPSASDDDVPF